MFIIVIKMDKMWITILIIFIWRLRSITTCTGAVVALLLWVLPGLLHPGEYLLCKGWGGGTGGAAGRGFLLLGCRAVGAGRGCRQWRCLLLHNTRSLDAAVALTAALSHAVAVQVTVFEGWRPDSRGLGGTHRALVVILNARSSVGLVRGAVVVRVWFGEGVASKKSRVIVVCCFLHVVDSKPISQCNSVQWHGCCFFTW